jgi:hypothetical protein
MGYRIFGLIHYYLSHHVVFYEKNIQTKTHTVKGNPSAVWWLVSANFSTNVIRQDMLCYALKEQ